LGANYKKLKFKDQHETPRGNIESLIDFSRVILKEEKVEESSKDYID
jgi:hypothetical protein